MEKIIYNNEMDKIVIVIGGTGGGFYGPAYLYTELFSVLPKNNIGVMGVDISPPLDNAVINVINSVKKIIDKQIKITLIGWSMGGAVVIQTGYNLKKEGYNVNDVITIASQTQGTQLLKQEININLYLIHGMKDKVIPDFALEHLYRKSKWKTKKYYLKNSTHFCLEDKKDLYNYIFLKILKQ